MNWTTRRAMLALLACLPFVLTGCGAARGVNNDNIDLVTWFIEDVAHGQTRNPQELVLPNSSEEMERLATWLTGTSVGDQYHPPRQLANRRERWSVIKTLFRQGQAVVLDDGLIAASPQLPKDDQAYALPIIDAENLDRRALDALVIAVAKAEHAQAKVWLAHSSAARLALDVQGGATRRVGKY